MVRAYVIAICDKCKGEYRSNGKSKRCQYCQRGVSGPPKSADVVAAHRCGKCGRKITTRDCLGCMTLERIESAKKQPVEVSEPNLVALDK